MSRITIILLFYFLFIACQKPQDEELASFSDGEHWTWLQSDTQEVSSRQTIFRHLFGDNDQLRLHQSMSLFDNKIFCFNHGVKCNVFDYNTKQELYSLDLPESSHHNNAQFLDVFLNKDDQFPLLLLSRGDYPPNQNEFYIVRVEELNDTVSFKRIKTIRNAISEANYGGSWVADTQTQTLFLYTMTKGDWRVKDNKACVYSFQLPDLTDPGEVVLGYDDVQNYWEYSYLIYQGGAFYNGYLLFNVQSLSRVYGKKLESQKSVLAINTNNGLIEAVLPLKESMETEGICVYNDKLYVSFKDGSSNQKESDTVLKILEYSLPESIINN